MSETACEPFWNWRRVLWYSVIVGLVIFAVYKQALVLFILERTMQVAVTLLRLPKRRLTTTSFLPLLEKRRSK